MAATNPILRSTQSVTGLATFMAVAAIVGFLLGCVSQRSQDGLEVIPATSSHHLSLRRTLPGAAAGNTTALIYTDLLLKAVSGALYDEMGRCHAGDGSCGTCEGQKQPYDPQLRETGADWPVVGHTMIGLRRLRNIRDTVADVIDRGVPGHFAELGVWRGGGCIMAKAVIDVLEGKRNVYVFDAFETIPAYGGMASFLSVKEQDVRHNFEKYGLLDERVIFQKGLFRDTVPAFRAQNSDVQLAVLRIDGNFYDSHQDVFYYMYEMVPVGGYIIFDDIYNGDVVMRAWTDFQNDQGFKEEVIRVDNLCGYFRKTQNVKVDMSKMRPPQDVNKV